jgi:transposase
MAYKRYSQEEIATIKKLVLQGRKHKEIAEILERHPGSTSIMIAKLRKRGELPGGKEYKKPTLAEEWYCDDAKGSGYF